MPSDLKALSAKQEHCPAEDWVRDGRGLWAMRACISKKAGHTGRHLYSSWKYNVEPVDAALSAQGAAPPCQLCGGPHRYDVSIPSEVWNRVVRANDLPEYLWQPIATAPKDGKSVLLWFGAAKMPRYGIGKWAKQDWPQCWEADDGSHYVSSLVTHWMPLSPAPTGGEPPTGAQS